MTGGTPSGWQDILADGETILWQGQPDGRLDFSGFWSVQTVFAGFFTAFAMFWMAMSFSMTSLMDDGVGQVVNIIFPLFGLPFLGVGLYMLVGRFWADAQQRRSTHYTLTTHAAYIGVDAGAKRSLDRHAIGVDTRLTLMDGTTGTVWFAPARATAQVTRNSLRVTEAKQRAQKIGFERISDPRAVYAMMRDMRMRDSGIGGKDV